MPYDGDVEKFRTAEVDDPVKQVLIEARAVILKQGWCQYSFMNAHQRVCSMGAVHRADAALCKHDDIPQLIRVVANRLLLAVGEEWGSIVGRNDTEGRTQEEVIAAFDRAIELS